tara:strand:- start:222 stop:380 length:159 start_codon:yes stop_codon:yes gene_type:complete
MDRMMIKCDVCNGHGKLEFALAADNFREDDCDMCDGKGKLSMDDYYSAPSQA